MPSPATMNRLAFGMIAAAAAWTAPAAGQAAQEGGAAQRQLRRTPVVEVFERARDAVVNIASTEIVAVRRSGPFDRMLEDFFDLPARPRELKRQSIGSGFVIHPAGYIVTNAHVVSRTAERKVVFADGREFEAQIVADDPTRDLAVLKVDTDRPLPTLALGRSDDLMVGETVIAIGNPLGFQHTVTAGVVSAVGRDLEFPNDMALRGLIQTDASINPGNSGGPLLNVLGQLIGVNTAIRGDAQNIGFAIPVDRLREILPELLDVHRRYRIESGMLVSSYRNPRVTEVVAGSPAARAGVREGDVLREVDAVPVREGVDFFIGLIGKSPGDAVRLGLERDGRPLSCTLVLDERPMPDGAELASTRLGIVVEPLPASLARELRLPGESGLLVVDVEPGGPADRVALRRRDILVALGRYYVSSVDELGQLLEQVDRGDEMAVSVLRVERGRTYRLSGTVVAR
ncbi:MAG: trypsin-like peptidase domain-containing protein [Planctomycetota bacterium]|jgi:serine protease Do